MIKSHIKGSSFPANATASNFANIKRTVIFTNPRYISEFDDLPYTFLDAEDIFHTL